jgi:hypothetical protein
LPYRWVFSSAACSSAGILPARSISSFVRVINAAVMGMFDGQNVEQALHEIHIQTLSALITWSKISVRKALIIFPGGNFMM